MKLAILSAVATLLAGCATNPVFESVTSRPAEVEWRLGDSLGVLAVDFQTSPNGSVRLIARADGASLELSQFPERWSADGSLAKGGWTGVPDEAPIGLTGWVALALAYHDSTALSEGITEYRTARYSVRYRKSAGSLRALELVAADSGDRFRVTFRDE